MTQRAMGIFVMVCIAVLTCVLVWLAHGISQLIYIEGVTTSICLVRLRRIGE